MSSLCIPVQSRFLGVAVFGLLIADADADADACDKAATFLHRPPHPVYVPLKGAGPVLGLCWASAGLSRNPVPCRLRRSRWELGG